MYAIYNKLNGKVVSRFDGEEHEIGKVYDLNICDYIKTTNRDLNGDVNEFVVGNGKVIRRNIDEIINEIESKNPIHKDVKSLKNENAEIRHQNMTLEVKLTQENKELKKSIAELEKRITKLEA